MALEPRRFDPRPPGRATQKIKRQERLVSCVSIHAPPGESDARRHEENIRFGCFDPRPPGESDTANGRRRASSRPFRSTPPRGERPEALALFASQHMFRSTPPRGERPKRRTGATPSRLARSCPICIRRTPFSRRTASNYSAAVQRLPSVQDEPFARASPGAPLQSRRTPG